MRLAPMLLAAAWVAGCSGVVSTDTRDAGTDGLPDAGAPDAGAPDGGGGDGTFACGDAAILGRLTACKAATDQAACAAAGGTWRTVGLSPDPLCVCPTGQGACPCNGPGDCAGSCIAQLPGGLHDCAAAVGRCSEVHVFAGCFCMFLGGGGATALCID